MNRRNLLTAAMGSVMLPGAVKAAVAQAQPDAELISACNQFLSIQRAWEAYAKSNPHDIEEGDPAVATLEPLSSLVEQIVALRATTAEGFLARARCRSFHWLPQAHVCQDNPENAPDNRFEAAEMRDLVAMERGAVISRPVAAQAPIRHPDADLLEACAAFNALERAYIDIGGHHQSGNPARRRRLRPRWNRIASETPKSRL